MAKRLPADELKTAMNELEGWTLNDADKLEKSWTLDDFDDAMRFIERVADIARELDHHPELHNVYNNVRLELTTHDAGGITERDIVFARRANALKA